MPDPLDPTHAFTSAFTGVFVSFGGVIAVSLGGHAFGSMLHEGARSIAAIPTAGWSALSAPAFHPVELIFTWIACFVGSLVTWRGWPFLLFDAWLLVRLRSGMELFQVLLLLAITQPLHSLLLTDKFSPLTAAELGVGAVLWLIASAAIAALALWWRHTSENAPEPEAEPEL
ncbi:MAG: hypothetical protein ABMA13_08335 [Chthoniobacteraceae bacterium]